MKRTLSATLCLLCCARAVLVESSSQQRLRGDFETAPQRTAFRKLDETVPSLAPVIATATPSVMATVPPPPPTVPPTNAPTTLAPSLSPSTTAPSAEPSLAPTSAPTKTFVAVPVERMFVSFVVQDEDPVNLLLVEQQLGAFVTFIIGTGSQEYPTYRRSDVNVTTTSLDVERRVLKEQVTAEIVMTAFFADDPYPTTQDLTDRVQIYFDLGTGYDDLETVLVSTRTGIENITDLLFTIGEDDDQVPPPEEDLIDVALNPIDIFFVVQDEDPFDEAVLKLQIEGYMAIIIKEGTNAFDTFERSSVNATVLSFEFRQRRFLRAEVSVEVLITAFFSGEPYPSSREMSDFLELYFVNSNGYETLEAALVQERTGIQNITDLQVTISEPQDGGQGGRSGGSSDAALIGGLTAASIVLAGAIGGTLVACWKANKRQRMMK